MIKYALVCDAGHDFDSWFSDSASYDVQVKRGFVECPLCQSKQISKALMAPAVSTSRKREAIRETMATQPSVPAEATAPVTVPAPASVPPVALLDEQQQAVRAMIRDLHQKLTETSVDVGDRFPEEARRMHEGDSPQRSIRGQATLDEAKALLEEGIPVLPIPTLPDDRN